jgi:hypothetical protein
MEDVTIVVDAKLISMQNSMESTIEALDQWFIFLNSPNYQQSG